MPPPDEFAEFEEWEAAVALLEENEVALIEHEVRLALSDILLRNSERELLDADDEEVAEVYLDRVRRGLHQQSLFRMEQLRLRRNQKTLFAHVAQCREEWGG